MTRVAIVPEPNQNGSARFRAISGGHQSVGSTAGQALDALTATLPESESGSIVIVKRCRPDNFFTAPQQERLRELMRRWRTARDDGKSLPSDDQAELDALIEAETLAASKRAAAMIPVLEE